MRESWKIAYDISKKVKQEGECLIWQGSKTLYGYGRIMHNGKQCRVHRVVWEIAHGEIPEGNVIIHICDNTSCVNIEHLRCGTQADNVADKVSKGRQAFGCAPVNPFRGKRNRDAVRQGG